MLIIINRIAMSYPSLSRSSPPCPALRASLELIFHLNSHYCPLVVSSSRTSKCITNVMACSATRCGTCPCGRCTPKMGKLCNLSTAHRITDQWSQFMGRGLEPMGRAGQAFSFRPTLLGPRAHAISVCGLRLGQI